MSHSTRTPSEIRRRRARILLNIRSSELGRRLAGPVEDPFTRSEIRDALAPLLRGVLVGLALGFGLLALRILGVL